MNEVKITPEIEDELSAMQAFLEEEYDEEPTLLVNRLTRLNVYMARTGFLLAVAEQERDKAIAATFAQNSGAILKMPSMVSQKFISALCERENYLVTWIERIHRVCVHQIDSIRTQVSYAKEEVRLTRSGY